MKHNPEAHSPSARSSFKNRVRAIGFFIALSLSSCLTTEKISEPSYIKYEATDKKIRNDIAENFGKYTKQMMSWTHKREHIDAEVSVKNIYDDYLKNKQVLESDYRTEKEKQYAEMEVRHLANITALWLLTHEYRIELNDRDLFGYLEEILSEVGLSITYINNVNEITYRSGDKLIAMQHKEDDLSDMLGDEIIITADKLSTSIQDSLSQDGPFTDEDKEGERYQYDLLFLTHVVNHENQVFEGLTRPFGYIEVSKEFHNHVMEMKRNRHLYEKKLQQELLKRGLEESKLKRVTY